ncbi:5-(carboxyamino)imidazole ribonucleotide synthase [Aureliella helgolandensis]|uniref:N5-carboxyaminoimidazole ribonucleotide synthase n=1 Tax=Aureliella helgolandensis TaxID=2527968 RepID=A0A518G796_9BACT|nr:5-(carboxyamino)imidazole ribonucleotide synthase [Aureliella helgolandensis]QDV24456.1 N5-carboxyaminoimidazole ribonucleotide synthase [Aureliella helgolandensis]
MQSPILPGSWLGVIGGGQLGRMFTHAAQRLGYHVAVLDAEEDCPAAQAADMHFLPSDEEGTADILAQEMSRLCASITLEFENVSAELLRIAGQRTRVCPSADFLEVTQDRITEKSQLVAAGFPTTPFRPVTNLGAVVEAGEELGYPLVLKTSRSGYDGKGQVVVRSEAEVEAAWESLETNRAIAEQMIEFEAEVSMITARNASGQIESYPLFENEHSNHILSVTRCPVSSPLKGIEEKAEEICHGIAGSFGVTGLFCVEFFVTKEGELLINEIAPRPHNSGHLTIEAFTCSQFEQQVRAICNLPLVPATMIHPAAMINLMGELWEGGEPDWTKLFAATDSHLHLYGKSDPRAGRKMGHLTVLDQSSSEAAITAKELRDSLIAEYPSPASID